MCNMVLCLLIIGYCIHNSDGPMKLAIGYNNTQLQLQKTWSPLCDVHNTSYTWWNFEGWKKQHDTVDKSTSKQQVCVSDSNYVHHAKNWTCTLNASGSYSRQADRQKSCCFKKLNGISSSSAVLNRMYLLRLPILTTKLNYV